MITVIGDLAVDILVNKGRTNYATDTDGQINFRPGGQANNVASFIGRENVACQLIGKVGDDPFGTYLIEESRKQGVTPIVKKEKQEKTGSIVIMIDNHNGERTMITDRGANLKLTAKDIQDVENSDILYLSGYSLFTEHTKDAAQKAKDQALKLNIPIALDPSSTYFLKDYKEEFLDFLNGITFFFPNYEEGVLLTGEKEPRKILDQLKRYVSVPILTLGHEGCLLDYENVYKHLAAPKVEAIDTTAAGDSFVGGFLATYRKTQNILEATERAIEISSKTVTYHGALPSVTK
ncbi:carbohydrate kinase family protein [Piscibacillus halophilus]|uniref:Ribokinase n=1 Tax=Piscibacillus halophilus TaxID=571933 RepID=A0A1H9JVF6_9BACI|nr:carbohydrate kinase family protein [Piscibacillus halophilus]SEQ90818.1 ribokinase [Piscibacillus halophilus]